MVLNLLIKVGLWIIQQPWFRLAVVKFITSAVENTETEIDDKIVEFISEHRRSLMTIVNKEVVKVTSEVDDRLVEAIKTVPITKKE